MAIVVPTVTAEDAHAYKTQLEAITSFASRIHLDFMDGQFTPNKSIDLSDAWLPKDKQIDLHLMYADPGSYVDQILIHNPFLVIVHAEAEGDYNNFAHTMHKSGIKTGVALLQQTPAETIIPSLELIDHVLVFSGSLGHFGGSVDLDLLDKVKILKSLKPELEIGWDGGITADNARYLADGGVNVLNVGGAIQNSNQPASVFGQLNHAVRERV